MLNITVVKKIANCLFLNKASDIVVLDVRGKSDLTDFFILATGASTTHIRSLPDHVKKEMLKQNIMPLRREGLIKDTRWTVLDYGFVIIHIFTADVRELYTFESIWGDAKKVKWESKIVKK